MASSSTDVDGLEQLMDELVEICESKKLSIESLKAKTLQSNRVEFVGKLLDVTTKSLQLPPSYGYLLFPQQ